MPTKFYIKSELNNIICLVKDLHLYTSTHPVVLDDDTRKLFDKLETRVTLLKYSLEREE
jgi:hypothetical protein